MSDKFKKRGLLAQLKRDYFGRSTPAKQYDFGDEDIRDDIQNRLGWQGDLLDIYVEGAQQLIHKWHHYLPIYDRYFARFRGTPVRFLEIGVSKGGSLSMWRRFFGPDAIIYGIDIDEACKVYDGIDGQVRIGSQTDGAFLSRVIEEMGGVDIILDDGSHQTAHVRASVELLMSMVSPGGVYMIEDLHTSYWKAFGGGFFHKNNFFNYVRRLIDDQHHWYHQSQISHPDVANYISSIHIHDSIVVLEQGKPLRPTHSKVQR